MYYRRKILLALVESFGGSLTEMDGHHLLFLFCLRRGKPFYDFFPTSNGQYSLVLHQDKERLTALRLLAPCEGFQIRDTELYVSQLTEKDRAVLLSFASQMENVRGEELVHKATLEVHFSEVQKRDVDADCIGSPEQSCLFTLGYEGLSIDAYLDILLAHQVSTVIDVRKNPLSRKYGFSKKQFMNATKVAGINYVHLPDLGVPSQLRRHLDTASAYEQLFHYYETDILPEHTEALEQLKKILNDDKRVVLTCFEADPMCCHRHKIVECLESDPQFVVPVVHLCSTQNCTPSPISSLQGNTSHGLLAENAVYSLS